MPLVQGLKCRLPIACRCFGFMGKPLADGMPMGKRKNFSIGSRKIRRRSHRKNFRRTFHRPPELRQFFAGKIAGKLIRRHFHRNFLPKKSESGRISEVADGNLGISGCRDFLPESYRKSGGFLPANGKSPFRLPETTGNRKSGGYPRNLKPWS